PGSLPNGIPQPGRRAVGRDPDPVVEPSPARRRPGGMTLQIAGRAGRGTFTARDFVEVRRPCRQTGGIAGRVLDDAGAGLLVAVPASWRGIARIGVADDVGAATVIGAAGL